VTGTFDIKDLRNAMGSFMTGVTVVTTTVDGERRGFTANSFTSVSLEPPLVLVCLSDRAESYAAFSAADVFAVNILHENQRDSAMRFASKRPNKFEDIAATSGRHGAPILDGSICWFECTTHDRIVAGDHMILIGRIVDYASADGRPLGYFRGGFVTPGLDQDRISAHAGAGAVVGCLATHDGAVLLMRRAGTSEWVLPQHSMVGQGGGRPQAKLKRLVSELGSELTLSFLYSVFEHGVDDAVYIIYRGTLDAPPRSDRFGDYEVRMFRNEDMPWNDIDAFLYGALLRRYFDELSKARFGVYARFDDQPRVELLQSSTH
jgi:flavin reductase (DIM6/NTAB) family NADH-FMN oxidoreductase RutF